MKEGKQGYSVFLCFYVFDLPGPVGAVSQPHRIVQKGVESDNFLKLNDPKKITITYASNYSMWRFSDAD